MRRIESHRFVWSCLFALALSVGGAVAPSYAQDTGATQTRTDDRDDDDSNLGWLGLLGLAGLLGLRRRDHVTHVDTTRSTTTRP